MDPDRARRSARGAASAGGGRPDARAGAGAARRCSRSGQPGVCDVGTGACAAWPRERARSRPPARGQRARDVCQARCNRGARPRCGLAAHRPAFACADLSHAGDTRREDQVAIMTNKEHSVVYQHDVGLAPPPVEIASDVQAIRERLQQALVLERTGHTEESLALAREARTRTEQLSCRTVHAQALFQIARALDGRHTAEARREAEALYVDALEIAEHERCEPLVAAICVRLVQLALQESGTQQAHARWHKANAACRTASCAYQEARLHHLRGEIHYRDGDYAEAASEQSLAIAAISDDRELPPERRRYLQLELSQYRGALATALEAQGLIDEAVALHEDAWNLSSDALGPSHPDVIKLQMNHGLALKKQGKLDRARAVLEAALASMPPRCRSSSLDAGVLCTYLSEVSYYEGKLVEAAGHARKALRIYKRVGAPDRRRAEAYSTLGNAELKRKNFRKALARYEEALALRRPHLRDDHYQVGVNEGSIAEALLGLSRYDEAMAHVVEAERILARGSICDRECQAWILSVKGEVLLGQHRLAEAVTVLEQALPQFEGAPDPGNQAWATWALARALHGLGRDVERVRQLAEAARALFARLGPSEARNRNAVEQFLQRLTPVAA
ncbi:MAG: tetratricopeptide repeat protein [Deltaproteobacteria bacterium]|nr:MAG: tetratricopeptide repeat protein [Deltaproteobacteria bacterium]